ncbi:PREDICTED: poly, partial [Prunus dulcis]
IIEMNDLDKHLIFPAKNYLRDNPHPLNKPRIFYETLLIETKSVNIVHLHRAENTNRVAFSKIQILNVISLEKWGPSPKRARRFIHLEIRPYSYNFWDYKKAWEYVL